MKGILHFLDRVYMKIAGLVLSPRNSRLVQFDLMRLWVRLCSLGSRNLTPPVEKLHLGCGRRKIPGWLNVDVWGGEFSWDIGSGRLPWRDNVFEAAVSQHMIEHLELDSQCIPLFKQVHRVLKPDGQLWLSCPDIAKICKAYQQDQLEMFLERRHKRWPQYSLEGKPDSQLINDLFHQWGQHKNLFDFQLLAWALNQAGFEDVREVSESDLLARFPEFPKRDDEEHTIYVCATKQTDSSDSSNLADTPQSPDSSDQSDSQSAS